MALERCSVVNFRIRPFIQSEFMQRMIPLRFYDFYGAYFYLSDRLCFIMQCGTDKSVLRVID